MIKNKAVIVDIKKKMQQPQVSVTRSKNKKVPKQFVFNEKTIKSCSWWVNVVFLKFNPVVRKCLRRGRRLPSKQMVKAIRMNQCWKAWTLLTVYLFFCTCHRPPLCRLAFCSLHAFYSLVLKLDSSSLQLSGHSVKVPCSSEGIEDR